MSGWISVDDRLPMAPCGGIIYECVECIVTDGVLVGVCDFKRGSIGEELWVCWSQYGDMKPEHIAFWMPLPEPPTTDDGDK